MLGVAAAAAKASLVLAAATVTLTAAAASDPATPSSDHTTLLGALVVGGLAFMGTLVTVIGNYMAQRHIKTAGEANDALVDQLVDARTRLELEKLRAKSARRHAWANYQQIIASREHLIAKGVDESLLPPVPEQPPAYDDDDEWGGSA